MKDIIIRQIQEDEIKNAIELVWRTFLEYEAPDYTEVGINEFKKAIDDKEWVNSRCFIGAFDGNEIVGVIATKDKCHIALFFVDGRYHRQGIGRRLYNYVCNENEQGYFTVNSSPYAHEVYKHLGFVDTVGKQSINGLIFYPMRNDNIEK